MYSGRDAVGVCGCSVALDYHDDEPNTIWLSAATLATEHQVRIRDQQ